MFSMCPGTQALAYANELVGASTPITSESDVAQSTSTQYASNALKILADTSKGATYRGEITSNTHALESGIYDVKSPATVAPDASGNGLKVADGAHVLVYIPEGVTLTVTGKDGSGQTDVGKAAIYLPEDATLAVTGLGTLNATGGNAGNGAKGGNAGDSHADTGSGERGWTGDGGAGGAGGAGAGAGIGTNGAQGGAGGAGGKGAESWGGTSTNIYGNDGGAGTAGASAAQSGSFFAGGAVTVNAKGGNAGTGGSGGGYGNYSTDRCFSDSEGCGASGGGGGGGAGSGAYAIGSGGFGGGGGGGGASGGIDGEATAIGDIDNFYGNGGLGGSNGGGAGASGKDADSDEAYDGYAKSGGRGGATGSQSTGKVYTYTEFSNLKVTLNNSDASWRRSAGYTSVIRLDSAEAFTALCGVETYVTLEPGSGVFRPVDKVTKEFAVIPGITPLSELQGELKENGKAYKRAWMWDGYTLKEGDDSQRLCTIERNAAGDPESYNWQSGALTDSGLTTNTAESFVWTGLEGATLYPMFVQTGTYTIKYDLNSIYLKTLGCSEPNWVDGSGTTYGQGTEQMTQSGVKTNESATLYARKGGKATANQTRFAYSAPEQGFLQIGWTTAVDETGKSIGEVFTAGSTVTALADSYGTVTLYALWAPTEMEDLQPPAVEVVEGDDYQSVVYGDDTSLEIKATVTPNWARWDNGDYYSPLIEFMQPTDKTYKVNFDWVYKAQNATQNDKEWQEVASDAFETKTNGLVADSLTESDAYKQGALIGESIESTLTVPKNLAAGEYVYALRITLQTQVQAGEPMQTVYQQFSEERHVVVYKASYDTSGMAFDIADSAIEYDGEGHEATLTGVPEGVTTTITYFDSNSKPLQQGSLPKEPGNYGVLAEFTSDGIVDGTYEPIERIAATFSITKAKVDAPTPAKGLVFKVDWNKNDGSGIEQTGIEAPAADAQYTATAGASLTGSNAGNYSPTFKLIDPVHYEWADGTAVNESPSIATVPWSIAQEPFDPSDFSVWGATPSDTTLSFQYDGAFHAPRPWFKLGTAAATEFPAWLSHWTQVGSAYVPKEKNSAYIVYYDKAKGDAAEGIVGYHKGANGAYEPVTATQIYLWTITDGAQDGDTIESKVSDSDGDASATRSVTVHSFDYITDWGVKDIGSYHAEAIFPDGDNVYPSNRAAADFEIGKIDISKATVNLKAASSVYTGKAQQGAVTSVVLNGKTLAADSYTVTATPGTNVGSYNVTVTGKGNYTGSATAKFSITPASLGAATVTLAKTSYTYTGKALKPAVKSVTLNGATVAAANYSVAYAKNTNKGTATVTVTGKGNYTGSATVTFKINAAAQTIKAKKSSYKVKLSKVKKAKQKVAVGFTASGKGKVTWAKASKGKVSIAKNGKVTVKKGTKKGTYKLPVKVTAAAKGNYKRTVKTVTLKIVVK